LKFEKAERMTPEEREEFMAETKELVSGVIMVIILIIIARIFW